MRGFLRQDVNFSVRTLIKNLGFTITAVLTLALGIGATTAIFSVVYAVFEPMPYPKPDQLVMCGLGFRARETPLRLATTWNGSAGARPSRT